jgi:predicted permease
MKKLLRVFHLGLWGPSVRDGVDWEIRHHLDERIEELLAAGMTREQAEVEAMRALGDVSRLRRELNHIDAGTERRFRFFAWAESFMQDVRYGLRAVRLNSGFAAAVVLTLGLGLGATVALFAVVDALLLRPLPYRAPDELANVMVVNPKSERGRPYVDGKQAFRIRESNTFFTAMFVHTRMNMLYTGGAEALDIPTNGVTADFEETLGVQPILGRGLTPEDARPGAPPVVLIDYGFWRSALGGGSDVLRRSVVLDGVPHAIVGVMPQGFKFPEYATTDAWWLIRDDITALGKPIQRAFQVTGRVRGDIAGASQRAAALGRALFTAEDPQSDQAYRLERFDAFRAGGVDMRESIWLMIGAVTLILLVAVVNVVNLLLIRMTSRTREMAVRLALGAGRMRLTRQLATEFFTLSLLAGLFAILVALVTLRAMSGIMPGTITFFAPYAIGIEQRALWFAFASTVLCGLLVSLGPAIAGSRQARTSGDDLTRYAARTRNKIRVRSVLVASQVALSVILLVGAGLLLNSFVRLTRVDPGIRLNNLALVTLNITRAAHPDAAERGEYIRRLEERLEALPGVQGVTVSAGLPPNGAGLMFGVAFEPEGQSTLPVDDQMVVPHTYVRPDFFDVAGSRLLAGRPFTAQDNRETSAIIDEDLARVLWPGRSAVGRRFRTDSDAPWMTVVGVMGDLKLNGPDDRRGDFEILYPYGDYKSGGGYTSIAIRTNGDPAELLFGIRTTIHSIDANQPIQNLQTARSEFAGAIDMPRFLLVLVAAMSALALTLAAIGIYGVLSYGVSQRIHEFGIRVALGAHGVQLRRMIVRQGFGLAALGALAGLGGALVASRFLRALLYGVQPTDPLTLAGMIVLMLAVAFLACLGPARRASRLDPAQVLRSE